MLRRREKQARCHTQQCVRSDSIMRRCLAVATVKLAAEAFMLVLMLILIAIGQEIFGDDDPFKPFALCYDEDLVGLKKGPREDLNSGQTTSVVQVLEPPYLAGEYSSTPVDFAPTWYVFNAVAVVATSCPCGWKASASSAGNADLARRIVVITEGLCASATEACSTRIAACAVQLAGASGLLWGGMAPSGGEEANTRDFLDTPYPPSDKGTGGPSGEPGPGRNPAPSSQSDGPGKGRGLHPAGIRRRLADAGGGGDDGGDGDDGDYGNDGDYGDPGSGSDNNGSPPAGDAGRDTTDDAGRDTSEAIEFAAALDTKLNYSCAPSMYGPTAYVSGDFSRLLATAALNSPALDVYEPDIKILLNLLRNRSADIQVVEPSSFRLYVSLQGSADPPNSTFCDKYSYAPFVYLVMTPVWWALFAIWAWMTYIKWTAEYRPIHSLLCAVPAVQFLHSALSLCAFSACPWSKTRSVVIAVFWALVTGLKGPLMLQALLLVAKGWCITRDELPRREG